MTLQPLLTVGLTNAALATALAALLWLVHRYARAPRVIRLLALVVLLRLLVPPVFSWDLLPTWDRASELLQPLLSQTEVEINAAAEAAPSRGSLVGPQSSPRISAAEVRRLATATWIVGIAIFGALCVVRERRFRVLLDNADEAPLALSERVVALAKRVGLGSSPSVRLVDGCLPPLVTRRRGADLLVLPRGLLERLDREELDTVLVHELAHLVRRDGIVRWIEIVACGLFWWNPVAWWARRRLREAEETCCDETVLRFLPRMSAVYASAIVKSLSSTGRRFVPGSASTMSSVRRLEERLKMILDNKPRIGRHWSSAAIVVASLVVLGVYPTFSQQSKGAQLPEQRALEELELDFQERQIDLEQRRLDLELRGQADAVEHRLEELDLEKQVLATLLSQASVAFADIDGDGWPDLYVANDAVGNQLLLKLQKGVPSLEQQARRQLEQLGELLENLGDDGGGREELSRLEATLRRLLEDRARQEEPEPE